MSDSMAGPAAGPAEREPGTGTGTAGPPADGPAAPGPLGVGTVPTGDAEVDGLLARLADADHLPTDGHVEVYEDVHRGLRDALTALDARPAPQGPQGPRPQGPR
ncbi:hypothetical protein ACFYYH_20650 [Streptomyces sp. NPDC002018]|uniref:hypothetical protein n=1 Tax=Streptomyces sp. NPDC002018 TaxID=3364629 RepID=UPI0036BD44E4